MLHFVPNTKHQTPKKPKKPTLVRNANSQAILTLVTGAHSSVRSVDESIILSWPMARLTFSLYYFLPFQFNYHLTAIETSHKTNCLLVICHFVHARYPRSHQVRNGCIYIYYYCIALIILLDTLLSGVTIKMIQ